ncbi:hypothetical protein GBAR_LOCUS7286 [Geodia barretti]|uniref:Uncharacterized protein n=1 Tax=Geodia barretti TaxID=519541 RepID=A0AA35RGU7_GEOBA|nr:hypothetical protein GBAR_LOCUS7286 [Geodia barretti]
MKLLFPRALFVLLPIFVLVSGNDTTKEDETNHELQITFTWTDFMDPGKITTYILNHVQQTVVPEIVNRIGIGVKGLTNMILDTVHEHSIFGEYNDHKTWETSVIVEIRELPEKIRKVLRGEVESFVEELWEGSLEGTYENDTSFRIAGRELNNLLKKFIKEFPKMVRKLLNKEFESFAQGFSKGGPNENGIIIIIIHDLPYQSIGIL